VKNQPHTVLGPFYRENPRFCPMGRPRSSSSTMTYERDHIIMKGLYPATRTAMASPVAEHDGCLGRCPVRTAFMKTLTRGSGSRNNPAAAPFEARRERSLPPYCLRVRTRALIPESDNENCGELLRFNGSTSPKPSGPQCTSLWFKRTAT